MMILAACPLRAKATVHFLALQTICYSIAYTAQPNGHAGIDARIKYRISSMCSKAKEDTLKASTLLQLRLWQKSRTVRHESTDLWVVLLCME